MEDMESGIRRAQIWMDERVCIGYSELVRILSFRLEYYTDEQATIFLQDEILSTVDRIIDLRTGFSVVKGVFNFNLAYRDMLWESSFVETLTHQERMLYRNCQNSESLPYFQELTEFVVKQKYLDLLKKRKKEYSPPKFSKERPFIQSKMKDIKPTLELNVNEAQMCLLLEGVNEARIFSRVLSIETFRQLFNCELESPLCVTNNKLLAYFLTALDDRSLITEKWQARCSYSQLFVSDQGNVLDQSKLSTATGQSRDKAPRRSEIIDKYMKQLQKH